MQIILQEEVEKLGTAARWWKSPKAMRGIFCCRASWLWKPPPAIMKRLEKMRAAFAKKEATEKERRATLAGLLAGVSLEFARKSGENDQLFGSVTSGDISEALAAKGYNIDKRKIVLADPIKLVGEYEVPVKLHREVTANIKIVVRKEE